MSEPGLIKTTSADQFDVSNKVRPTSTPYFSLIVESGSIKEQRSGGISQCHYPVVRPTNPRYTRTPGPPDIADSAAM